MRFEETLNVIKENTTFDNSKKILRKENNDREEKNYLKEILSKIKDVKTKELIFAKFDSGDIISVLYGIKPACSLDRSEVELIRNNLILSDDFVAEGNVLFNKHLVVEVAKNNPDYFNETGLDAEKIINFYFSKENQGKSNVQIGLLLGYPKKACEDYQRFNGKWKTLDDLGKIIPYNTADWRLCQTLADVITEHQNNNWGGDSEESPIIPPHLREDLKHLLYKYLPKNIADVSWERYQGKKIQIGGWKGVVWMEWNSNLEGEEKKEKYRSLFNNKAFQLAIEGELNILCKELINEKIAISISENDLIEIKNLALEIKYKYSNIQRGNISLESLLSVDYNSINRQPINSADDLIQYLKMLKDAYENDSK